MRNRMCPRVRSVWLIGFALLGNASAAHAYSCYEVPFVERVKTTANIFVAKITGGSLVERDGYREVEAGFEVIERLKGSIDFDRLTTSATYGMDSGIPFVIGGEYLVYASEDGKTGMCGNARALAPPELVTNGIAAQELLALRLIAESRFRKIVAPWLFSAPVLDDGYLYCSLGHELSFEADPPGEYPLSSWLNVSWVGGGPESARPPAWPLLSVVVGLPGGGDVSGYVARLQLGDRVFSMPAGTLVEGYPPESFIIRNDDARSVLALLDAGTGIVVEAGHPEYGHLRLSGNTSTAGNALTDFADCISRYEQRL